MRVDVDDENPGMLGDDRREIHRSCGLTGTALLVGDGDDPHRPIPFRSTDRMPARRASEFGTPRLTNFRAAVTVLLIPVSFLLKGPFSGPLKVAFFAP